MNSNTHRAMWPFPIGFAFLACLLLIVSVLAVDVRAAENALKLPMLEDRLSVLRSSGTPEDSDVFINYKHASDSLVQAEVYQSEKAQYIESLRTAPLSEAEIQRRIDRLESTPQDVDGLDALDRSELRARLLTERTDQEEAESKLAALDRRLSARESKSAEIRARLSVIRSQLDSLPQGVDLVGAGSGQPSASEALVWRAAAEHIALRAELQALEARLSSQPLRFSMMTVQRAELGLLASRLAASVTALEAEADKRTLEASDATEMGFDPSSRGYSVAQALVATDTALREERITLGSSLTDVRSSVSAIKMQSDLLRERYAIARRMVDFAGDSDTLGKVLLAQWQDFEDYDNELLDRDFSQESAATVIRRIEHEDALKKLTSFSSYVDSLLAEAGIAPDAIPETDYQALQKVAKNYRARLHSTIDIQSEYLEALTELADDSAALDQLSNEYQAYLTGLILWIPDYRPLWKSDVGYSLPLELQSMADALETGHLQKSGWLLISLLLFALLISQRRRLQEWLHELNRRVLKPRDDSIRHTLRALVATLLIVLPVPLLVAGLSTAFSGASIVDNYLFFTSLAILLLLFVRRLCAPEGVGVVHFGWSRTTSTRLHDDTVWLIGFWLPLLTLISWLVTVTPWSSHAIVIRTIVVLVLLPSLCAVILRMYRQSNTRGEVWLQSAMERIYFLVAVILIVVAIAVAFGHVYSVSVIVGCLVNTVWVGLGLVLLHSLLMRWILVTRRRLRMAELLEAQAGNESPEDVLLDEQVASLGDVSEDSRELVNVALAAAGVSALVYLWSPLLPAMDKLADLTLWTSSTLVDGEAIENKISLATVLIIAILASLTVYAARKLPAMIDLLLRSQTDVSASARYTVSALLNYTIIGGGTVAAFSAMGLQWSQLQWLVAALGVGIGFGLQEIIANFISGLIILFERPIRVGDVVSTGDSDGVVAKIRIRATTIVDWDGKELLVPNKEFITGRLLNWSLTDTKIRLVLPVGVAYGSDVERALKILYEVVSDHPKVLQDPEPSIIFDAFGDNALSLVARCFLHSMENRVGVMTELNKEIYRRFEEAGIVIAFPQRDIHFDSDKPLHITLDGGKAG